MNKFAKLLLIIYVVALSTPLAADPTLPGVVAATDGDPNAIVGGCVNAITGDLVLGKEDIVVRGALPLPIRRNYVSGNGKGRDCGWHFFFPHFILSYMELPPRCGHQAQATTPSGSSLLYYCGDKKRTLTPTLGKHAVGLTNTSLGLLSGRTNCKNSSIHFEIKNHNPRDVSLVTGEGHHCYYTICKHEGTREGCVDYVLTREELPNGCWILYEHDKYARPTSAKVVNPAQNKVFASARFHWQGPDYDNHNVRVETSDGQQIYIGFEQRKGKESEGGHRYYLYEVHGCQSPDERYVFSTPPKKFNSLLNEIIVGGETRQKIVYQYPNKGDNVKDKDDPRCNCVKELWSPSGPNGEWVRTHSFSYSDTRWKDEEGRFSGNGSTWVDGADGYKAEYQWSRSMRPLRILLYDTRLSDRPQLDHRFVWGYDTSDEQTDLKATALFDSNGNCLRAREFHYDPRRNPGGESLFGNLTGTYKGRFHMDDRGVIEGGERYHRVRIYSDDGRNLLLEEREDNGRIAHYRYLPGTSLLTAKLIGEDKKIWVRELYEYDGDHLLAAEIIDDGSSSDPHNLSGITSRVVKRIFRREDGMPARVEERCYDPATGQERLLKAIAMHYSARMMVTKQDIIDSEGQLAYSLHYEYDDRDRLVRQSDPLGRWTTTSYDHLGRPCRQVDPSGKIETAAYDACGRTKAIEHRSPEGAMQVEKYTYNALSHKTSTANHHGHTTRFHPDPHEGTSSKNEYPDGSWEQQTLNAMRRPVEAINRSGERTVKSYNAYGQPTHVQHPDGTEEFFVYRTDGKLFLHTDRLGAITRYSYDLMGRVLCKEVLDGQGTLLWGERNVYQGPHLVEHVNAEGESTTFAYDPAGRKIAETRNGSTTRFAYDSLGRLCSRTVSTSNEEIEQVTAYNLLGQVTSEKSFSSAGELLHEKSYSYDASGHVVETSINTGAGISQEKSRYDIFGRPTLAIDPLGHETKIQWDESALGTVRKITTDPIGTQGIEIFGAMERLLSKEILSPQGQRLAFSSFVYDRGGHCIEERTELPTKTLVTKREYVGEHLVALIEAAGTPEQKTTRYNYARNLLSAVEKNDGTLIRYTHDIFGRVATCQAATGDGYQYSYDHLHRVTTVTDLVRGTTSERCYGPSGAVSEEIFLHGLAVHYQRDVWGRPLALTLPDQTGIGYRWEAGRLQEISRLNARGEALYSHVYDRYDLCGRPVSSSLIAKLGSEKHSFDIAHRLNERATSWHYQVAKKRNAVGSVLETQTRILGFIDVSTFAYDPLQHCENENTIFFRHTFSFDAKGTPLVRDQTPCETNHLHQLQGVGGLRFSYDAAGNLQSDGKRVYRYDAFDRLVELEEPGVQKAEYIYDSWHRRMQKVLYAWREGRWAVVKTYSYLYDGMVEIGCTDEEGTTLELRILPPAAQSEAGSAVAIEIAGRLYAPFHSLEGHVIGLVDAATQQVVETYRYSAFGETRVCDAFSAQRATSATGNPWRYFSKRTDEESGLVYFGRRYYHPQLGSWITPDPAGSVDSSNLYLFLRANPLNLRDAIGLYATQPQEWQTPKRPDRYEPTPFSLAANHAFSTAGRPFGYTLYYGAYQLPVPGIREGIMTVGSYLARNPRCRVDHSFFGCHKGNGINDGLVPIYHNGVGGTKEDVQKFAKDWSDQLNGHSVWYAFNASNGHLLDLADCGMELLGRETHAMKVFRKGIIKSYEVAKQNLFGKEPLIVIGAHSEGCINTKIIYEGLNKTHPEIARHTIIYALGSPVILDRNLASEVYVRISKWDPVGWLDFVGRRQKYEHVKILEPIGSFPGLDHGLGGGTYGEEMEKISYDIRQRWRL